MAYRLEVGGRLWVAVVALLAAGVAGATEPASPSLPEGLKLVGEYKTPPALEAEVAGVLPHATDGALYYLAANRNPAYKAQQKPRLPEQYRGKLLTVNRTTGEVVKAWDLGARQYGGLAAGGGRLYVSSVEPPEILEVDPKRGKVLRRIPIEGPAGGLEYDASRKQLLAQLFVSHPHLAVIDVKSGAVVQSLWSDENAMDLAFVDGDLLCTWVSSFDGQAFSELRRVDPKTGKITGRIRLDGLHSSMKPVKKGSQGGQGFISLVTLDKDSGAVAIREYGYRRDAFR